MNYYVVDSTNGQKYGPADIATLNQWVTEGRITAQTILEDAATGVQVPATQVPGIALAPAPPSAPVTPPQAPYASPPVEQPPTAGPMGYQNPPQVAMATDQTGLIIASYILSVIGLGCCPIAFCGGGIACAVVAKNKGDQRGQTAMIVGVICLVAGFIIGAIIGASGFMNRLGR